MSQTLSHPQKAFFASTHLDCPTEENYEEVLKVLEEELKNNPPLGVWLEPLPQNTMIPTPLEFIKKCRSLCNEHHIPLIFNETASCMYRYTNDYFMVSNHAETTPDLSMIYLSGQGALVYCKEEFFIDKPLMMISTWDGDEYSFKSFERALDLIESNREEFFKIKTQFEKKLSSMLDEYHGIEYKLHNGSGWITGNVPLSLANRLRKKGNSFLVCPNYSSMKRFLND